MAFGRRSQVLGVQQGRAWLMWGCEGIQGQRAKHLEEH